MPRPGVDVLIVDEAAPGGPQFQTGRAFFVGATERGPVAPTELTSAGGFASTYGERAGQATIYDSVAAFFLEGGASLIFARAVGATAETATAEFGDMTVDATSPGTWGNGVTVKTAANGVIVVTEDGTEVERSPATSTGQDAIDWAQSYSSRVVISGPADGTLPAAADAAVPLAGGTDVAPVDADVATALDRFHTGYGPGQVCVPGNTDSDVHKAIGDHCAAFQRCGIVDLPDDPDALVLGAAVNAIQGREGARYCLAVAPPALYPVGSVGGAVAVVPYSAIEAGMIARVDAQGNPAMPAAGAAGVSSGAVGLTQEFTQDDRTTLNDEGVTLAREMYGSIRTYGYRTAAGPTETNWVFFGESRTVMAIAHECGNAAENYLFRPIDGRGHLISAFTKDLVGICSRYLALGALYGATDNDAYRVDTGATVNTEDTKNRGEIRAVVKLKTSRDAEWVVVEITKVPLDRAL